MPRGPYASESAFAAGYDALDAAPGTSVGVITDVSSGAVVGSLSFMSHVPDMFRVELGGIWLTPAVRGRALLASAVYALLQHLFDGLAYRRVEWKCDTRNAASMRAAERLGFLFEGACRVDALAGVVVLVCGVERLGFLFEGA